MFRYIAHYVVNLYDEFVIKCMPDILIFTHMYQIQYQLMDDNNLQEMAM